MDGGFLYTLKELLLRPGDMIRDYLNGKRKRHVPPASMLMIICTVIIFISHLWLKDNVLGSTAAFMPPPDTPEAAEFHKHLLNTFNWVEKNFSLATVLLLPLEALGYKLGFRAYRDINFAEWLVITAYMTSLFLSVYVVGLVVSRFFFNTTMLYLTVLLIGQALVLIQFFRGRARWWAVILRYIGSLAIYLVLCELVFVAAVIWSVKHSA